MKIFTETSSRILVWAGIILILLGLFIFQIGEELFLFGNEIKSDKIGQLGDFFGGVIGSLWALAGVILFYVALNKQIEALENQKKSTTAAIKALEIQSTELKLQRDELKETRKEFLLNRTTNLVYKQLDRFERSLKDFTIYETGHNYSGGDAIALMDKNKELPTIGWDTPEDDKKKLIKESTIKALKFLSPKKIEIEKFAQNAYNSIVGLQRLIYKSHLDIDEINDLKNLFFDNIGFITMGVLEQILIVNKNSIKYLVAQDYLDNKLEVGALMRVNIFLESIIEFNNLKLTDKNFEEKKNEWITSRGGNG